MNKEEILKEMEKLKGLLSKIEEEEEQKVNEKTIIAEKIAVIDDQIKAVDEKRKSLIVPLDVEKGKLLALRSDLEKLLKEA